MRTSGRPSSSTVASDMALASLGSLATASASQSLNRAKGSASLSSGRASAVATWRT